LNKGSSKISSDRGRCGGIPSRPPNRENRDSLSRGWGPRFRPHHGRVGQRVLRNRKNCDQVGSPNGKTPNTRTPPQTNGGAGHQATNLQPLTQKQVSKPGWGGVDQRGTGRPGRRIRGLEGLTDLGPGVANPRQFARGAHRSWAPQRWGTGHRSTPGWPTNVGVGSSQPGLSEKHAAAEGGRGYFQAVHQPPGRGESSIKGENIWGNERIHCFSIDENTRTSGETQHGKWGAS